MQSTSDKGPVVAALVVGVPTTAVCMYKFMHSYRHQYTGPDLLGIQKWADAPCNYAEDVLYFIPKMFLQFGGFVVDSVVIGGLAAGVTFGLATLVKGKKN